MFSDLIESSSHRQEFKRRGSFLLFTTATYVLLFAIVGVVSIYAYDARLEEQTFEIVTMLPPVELSAQDSSPTPPTERPRSSNNNPATIPERQIAMSNLSDPKVVPEHISAKPNTNLPLPSTGLVRITGRDLDPGGPGGSGPGGGGSGTGQAAPLVVVTEPPPPPETRQPSPRMISKGVINSLAIFLPKPPYPRRAKQLHIQGAVSVQVLVDETGKVVSAKALAGHAFLIDEAQKAALEARFSPTLLGGQPVKVSGLITYNFVLF